MFLINSALVLQRINSLRLEREVEIVLKDLTAVLFLHMIVVPFCCFPAILDARLELLHIVIKLVDGTPDTFEADHHVGFLAKSLLVTLLVDEWSSWIFVTHCECKAIF